MITSQDNIFGTSEGDAWFARNADGMSRQQYDPLCRLLERLPSAAIERMRSACDVGCSSGLRLARLARLLPDATRLCGFDASSKAIDAGRAEHPGFDLRPGLVDAPPFAGPFDLVTIGFVLHWVGRANLSSAVAAIDRMVADGGYLLIADFLPDRPCARPYHHRQDVEIFTYKQDYGAAFTGLGLYEEIARETFAHDDPSTFADVDDEQSRAVAVILRKRLHYPVVAA
jgi:SAM-dependent methyltransferase